MARLPGYASALLNVIAGPESAGRYDVIYGGKRFDDFSDHPRIAVPIRSGPNAGKTSSAAGKYQFLGSTWDQYKNKLGLPDFSPQSQDMAAYALASDTYKAKTGRSLDATLQSGDPTQIAQVGKVLNPIWTSLPGGIEAGTNTNRFVSEFTKQISGGAPTPRATGMDLGGSPMADAGPKKSEAIGGLGGLGGFVPPERKKGLDWAGLLSALGDGLIYGDGRAIAASFDARQAQKDKEYEQEYGRARDDWMFGVNRQDKLEDRAERREDRDINRGFQQAQFKYQIGQDAVSNDRAERTLTLQERLATQKGEGYRTLTPEEVTQRGLPPGSYQIGPDGKLDEVGKQGGQNITVNAGPNESEFAKQAAGTQVKRFGAISEGGNAAASVVQTIPQLRELLAVAPQGPIQGRLAETFPGFSTAGDAFGAAVNQIAPTLRVAGSGAASDKDIDLLLGSFPRLRNDPAANTIILDAFQTKARINMERADIANAALRNEIKPDEADRRLQELDRQSILPEGLRQRLGVTKAPDTGLSPNQRNRPRATNPATGKVIEFDGKAWVPVS